MLWFSENSYVGPYRYYIPENNDVMGMGYHPGSGIMLITVSRLRPGIPSSLAAFCVSDYELGSSPKIWGFPNYEINALKESDFDGGPEESKNKRYWYRPNNNTHEYRNLEIKSEFHQYPHHVYEKPSLIALTVPSPAPTNPDHKPRLISVYHVNVDDKCNRVFFIDTGILSFYGTETYIIQNPALVEVSLPIDGCETREFIVNRRAEIPKRISEKVPFGLMFITLDYSSKNSCDDLFIYITNIYANYLLVYDYKNNEFWAFTDHETFLPVAAESQAVFDRTLKYENPLGIISIGLGYSDKFGDRTAFYITGASTAQFAVSTGILKNRRKAPRNYKKDDFRIMGYRGCGGQSVKLTVDYTYGVVFYADMNSYRIRCWNMNKPLNPDNIGVVFESEKLLYPLQIFVDSRGYLWFNTNHFPVIFGRSPLDLKEVNSRVFRIKVSEAIRGTVCED